MDIKVVRKGMGGANTLVYLDGKLCKDAVSIGWATGVDELVDTVVLEILCTNFSVDIVEEEDEYMMMHKAKLKEAAGLKSPKASSKPSEIKKGFTMEDVAKKEEGNNG